MQRSSPCPRPASPTLRQPRRSPQSAWATWTHCDGSSTSGRTWPPPASTDAPRCTSSPTGPATTPTAPTSYECSSRPAPTPTPTPAAMRRRRRCPGQSAPTTSASTRRPTPAAPDAQPAATSTPPGYANRARNTATRRNRIGGTDGSCRAVEITAPRLADRGDGAAGDEDEHADHDEHHGNQPVADPAEPGDHLP